MIGGDGRGDKDSRTVSPHELGAPPERCGLVAITLAAGLRFSPVVDRSPGLIAGAGL